VKHLPLNARSTAGWVLKFDFDRLPVVPVSGKTEEETK